MDQPSVQRALEAIDAVNAADPRRVRVDGQEGPQELLHGRRVSEWIDRLAPDASPALRIAGRAHHIERWAIPRESHPMNRPGYLAWRRALQAHHALRVRQVLEGTACPEAVIARVEELVQKKGLGVDVEAQTLEDAMCLVFFELQLAAFAAGKPAEKAQRILSRTAAKMSDAGRRAAAELALPAPIAHALREALRSA